MEQKVMEIFLGLIQIISVMYPKKEKSGNKKN